MPIRVLIVDDSQVIRDAIRTFLADRSDIQIVAEAENGLRAVHLARELRPDVIVMDTRMPVMDGLEATRRILIDNDQACVLAVSINDEAAGPTATAGARDFLAKADMANELVTRILALADGSNRSD
jgi:NarL family two-component system response regulator LiaR